MSTIGDEPAEKTWAMIDECHRTGWYKHFRPCNPDDFAIKEGEEEMTPEEKAEIDKMLKAADEMFTQIAKENGL